MLSPIYAYRRKGRKKGIPQDFSVYTSLCLSVLTLCMPCLVLLCSLTHTNGSYQMCTCGTITPINNMTATPAPREELLVFFQWGLSIMLVFHVNIIIALNTNGCIIIIKNCVKFIWFCLEIIQFSCI